MPDETEIEMQSDYREKYLFALGSRWRMLSGGSYT